MKSRYLKPIFKSGRSTAGTWRAIALGIRGPMHFLKKERRMNSDIYIKQVLEEWRLPIYKQCIWENGFMIWMDNGVGHHTSKTITEYRHRVGTIRMDWPAQSPDLGLVENLWRIIKVRVSAQRHRIRSLESMKEVIKEEWEKLTEDFRACIESMPKRCKLVILGRGGSIKYWGIYHVERSKLYHVY